MTDRDISRFASAAIYLLTAGTFFHAANAAPAPRLKPPAGFGATATSATSIQLKWKDTNSAEKGYLLEFRKGSGAFHVLAQLAKNSKSYTHKDLVGGTTYTYRLSAIWKKKRSASRAAVATTPDSATPTPTPDPGAAATPIFSQTAGTFTTSVQVSISTTTTGATIYYTTDGSDPTNDSTPYAGPLTLSATATLKARAIKSGLADSAVGAATYTIVVADPVFNPAPGTFSGAQQVTITCATPGVTIRCTINGTDPTAASTAYGGAITISASLTLKARAFKAGLTASGITSGLYTITAPTPTPTPTVATPVISPATGTYTDAVSATITCATSGASIYYTTNGATPTAASTPYAGAISLTSTTTLKAIGIKAGSTDSAVAATVFTITSSELHPKLSARAESSTSIRLNWLNIASNQASGMTIQRSPDGGAATAYANITTAAAGATTYLDTGLSPGQIYYYRSRATGTAEDWSYSTTVTNPTGTAQPPNPPSGLTVTAVTTTPEAGVTLTAQVLKILWTRNAVNGTDTDYIIEKSSDGEDFQLYATFALAQLSATGTARYRYDSAQPASAKLYYRVRAKGPNGISAPTDIASAVTKSNAAPGAPTNFTAQAAGPDTINLSWQNAAPIDGWRIYLSTGNGTTPTFSGTVNDAVTGASATIIQPVITLMANTKYNFQIDTFRNVNGTPQYSPKTAVASATTPAAAGLQFTNKSAYPIVSLKIDGTELFAMSPQGIPPGTASAPAKFTVAVANGNHTYSAQNGFWDGSSRTTLYSYSGSFTVSGGVTASALTFDAPTIAQLMTQFRNTSGTWSGWYAGGTGFIPVKVRFLANGTCTLSYSPSGGNYTTLGSGTYAMQTNGYAGTFVANFNIVLTSGSVTGTFAAKLSEMGGWFGATFPTLSPFAIQFNADGP